VPWVPLPNRPVGAGRTTATTMMFSTVTHPSQQGGRAPAARARGNTATDNVFSGLKVAELKEMLRQRQLPVSGIKPELVRRLVEHANGA
jgi:hypothetical protein